MAKYKQITEPDQHGYQVRIVRKGKEHSRYFAHRVWGSRNKSLEAAIRWRDQKLALLGKTNRKLSDKGPIASKKSTGIRGVTRSIQHDKRRDTAYLVYGVRWHDADKIKNRTFFVGRADQVTADQDFHALRTAVLFRQEYECCLELSQPFYPQRYASWKTTRIYQSGLNELLQTAPTEPVSQNSDPANQNNVEEQIAS